MEKCETLPLMFYSKPTFEEGDIVRLEPINTAILKNVYEELKRPERATEKQKAFLDYLGYNYHKNITKHSAWKIIKWLLKIRSNYGKTNNTSN